MENRISRVLTYPKAYQFMKKTGVQKSHATVPLRRKYSKPSLNAQIQKTRKYIIKK